MGGDSHGRCPSPCNKRRFSSKEAARKGNKSNHKRLRIYWSERCKTWHVTTEEVRKWIDEAKAKR